MEIPMKLAYQYMEIFFNFFIYSVHLHPLQVENCDSNSRLDVDEDDNGKFRVERFKWADTTSWVFGVEPIHGYFKAQSSPKGNYLGPI